MRASSIDVRSVLKLRSSVQVQIHSNQIQIRRIFIRIRMSVDSNSGSNFGGFRFIFGISVDIISYTDFLVDFNAGSNFRRF